MNEEQKNIETCLAENILAEVASVPQDPQFVSLVNESLDPLKQQALQQAGYADYEKFAWPHKPYTFTSPIRQMKSNLILLLRRLWRFPFGRGTIRSLAGMWQHYITRLSGNETYGIPSRLNQLTDLPSAPALLSDRKISAGESDVPDGMSLLQLVLSRSSGITKLGDPYVWDLCYRDQLYALIAALPSLNDLYIRCKRLTGYSYAYNVWFPDTITTFNGSSEVFEMPDLERFEGSAYIGYPTMNKNFKIWRFPKMKYCRCAFSASDNNVNENQGVRIDWVEEVYAPTLDTFGEYAANYNFNYFTVMKRAIFGNTTFAYDYRCFRMCPMLIHLELGADGNKFNHSNSFASWSPTMALRTDTTASDYVDLIEEGSTAANNLEQFLTNFRSFIILRLANRKSDTALTLTLSAAVYNAVTGADSGWASLHTLAELGITDNDLTDLETELGITTATIYATWLDTYTGANGIHWNVNKAN